MSGRSSPLLVNFDIGVSPQGQRSEKNDRAEILYDGRPTWIVGHISFWWTLAQGLARLRSKGEESNFRLEISRKRWQIRGWTPEALTCRTNRLSIGAVTFDLEWPWGSKIKVKLFDVKYVNKNGNSYDVGPIGFTLHDLERLKVYVRNLAVTAIGMWGYTPVGLTGVLVIHTCP